MNEWENKSIKAKTYVEWPDFHSCWPINSWIKCKLAAPHHPYPQNVTTQKLIEKKVGQPKGQPSVHTFFPNCRRVLLSHASPVQRRIWDTTLTVGRPQTVLSRVSSQTAQRSVPPSAPKVIRENSTSSGKSVSGLPSTHLRAQPEPQWSQVTWKLLPQTEIWSIHHSHPAWLHFRGIY